ncbi:MAG: DUF4340 domain-containing protein [Gammaproteobacteria bacterium]
MKARNLVALAGAAVVTLGFALWQNTQRTPDTESASGALLIPDLKAKINDLSEVRLVKRGAESAVTLNKAEGGWVVAEKDNYPADVGKLRKSLLDLADAKVLENKTSKPELYARLGVEDMTASEAAGSQIELKGMDAPMSVIIGKTAQGANGTYARIVDEEQSVLVSGRLTFDTEPLNWLQRDIINIAAGRVQEIRISQPGGELLTASKAGRDQQHFAVGDLPDGRELESPGSVNNLASVLGNLRLDDVKAVSEISVDEKEPVETVVSTFDGLVVTGKAFELDGKQHAAFAAKFDAEQAQRFSEEPHGEEEPSGENAEGKTGDQASAADHDKIKKEAEQINARLGDWVFQIPNFKYENLTKKMDDLLKPLEEEPESAAEAPPEDKPES